ncbi:hypothetical protein MTO98_09670 [Mucilaginibacter sp. SMC90]|uniref:hypothetical protein n=1 Tax=Mucilaginibacter sp. SMC90 TaxID=2929803 RepID=UPI001FB38240|nr:hypothetical protein [Mucilaginibacter sp. SMC90]UOE51345.1 hypothetical protein MTO98_09670 [Mucilaginibacter sp. SMC90]
MEKYMGYRAKAGQQQIQKELPTINIDGTLFLVDIDKHEFRQVDNPFNRMSLGDVQEEMGFSHFLYDTTTKNKYLGNYGPGDSIPEHVRIVLVPPLKDLDPIGLARRQGLPATEQSERAKQVQSLTTLAPKTKADRSKNSRKRL